MSTQLLINGITGNYLPTSEKDARANKSDARTRLRETRFAMIAGALVVQRGGLMDRFLIETSHGKEVCLNLIQLLNAQGYLRHFDWGCQSGIHTGWVVIEADNISEVRLAIPPLVRAEARIVQVTKFDSSTFAQMHTVELTAQNAVR
jgi:hypothetical protein